MEDHINDDKAFLGTGWSFPPTFNRREQSVEMQSGAENIDASLRILVTTRLGERAMRLNYGSKVADRIFEPMDLSQQELLRVDISDSIFLHEPRIVPLNVRVELEPLEGRITVQVDYRILATNTRRNFVYPFYIIEGTEIRP
ncbi:MAG: GPW/gp25 family protein [Bacteroidota bacterium]